MTQNKVVQPHKPAEKSPKTHNKVVIFLGPPGAGKGTQAERLASDQQLVKISTGDILRDHVSRGTELGQQVAPILESGKLVPDELLIALIRDQLSKMETVRVIFDGFPRTTAQAQELDMLLEELGAPISAVPLLDVPDDVVIARIVERGKTSGRNDDNERGGPPPPGGLPRADPAADRLLRGAGPSQDHQWGGQHGRGLPPVAGDPGLSSAQARRKAARAGAAKRGCAPLA